MKKSKFTESQIVAILKEGEASIAGVEFGSQARHQRRDVLQLEVEVRRGCGFRIEADARVGYRCANCTIRSRV